MSGAGPSIPIVNTAGHACPDLGIQLRQITGPGWGQPSFVNLAPVGKSAHTSAPGAVAAGFQILSHQCLYLVWPQPVQSADLIEAGMIAERHLDDFAKCRRVKELAFHRLGGVFAASQVKLAVLLRPFMQHETSALMHGGVALCSFVTVAHPLEGQLDFTAMKPYLWDGSKFVFRFYGRWHSTRRGFGFANNTRSASAYLTTG